MILLLAVCSTVFPEMPDPWAVFRKLRYMLIDEKTIWLQPMYVIEVNHITVHYLRTTKNWSQSAQGRDEKGMDFKSHMMTMMLMMIN